MKVYRAYRIDAHGSIISLVTFRADSDALACERAMEITADDKWPGSELWDGERHIHCDGVARLTTGEPDYWRTDATGAPYPPALDRAVANDRF